jgi:hypothetical protein
MLTGASRTPIRGRSRFIPAHQHGLNSKRVQRQYFRSSISRAEPATPLLVRVWTTGLLRRYFSLKVSERLPQNRARVRRSVRLFLVEVSLGLPMALVTCARHSTQALLTLAKVERAAASISTARMPRRCAAAIASKVSRNGASVVQVGPTIACRPLLLTASVAMELIPDRPHRSQTAQRSGSCYLHRAEPGRLSQSMGLVRPVGFGRSSPNTVVFRAATDAN